MKILIVDDSALMRSILTRALEQECSDCDLELLEAADGRQALERLRDGVDLVLLDWNMPVLDGLELVEQVRKAGDETPIVMVTAISDPLAIEEACAAGVNDYLCKPVKAGELWGAVEEYIK